MTKCRRYDLGFEELDEDMSMYEDNTPIITINDDYGFPEIRLVGREEINHYIKTGKILKNDSTNRNQ